jgi:hypothetical protein
MYAAVIGWMIARVRRFTECPGRWFLRVLHRDRANGPWRAGPFAAERERLASLTRSAVRLRDGANLVSPRCRTVGQLGRSAYPEKG